MVPELVEESARDRRRQPLEFRVALRRTRRDLDALHSMRGGESPGQARGHAGAGEIVLVCQGSSARLTPETGELPIDAVVIGIVDSVGIGDRTVFESGREIAR